MNSSVVELKQVSFSYKNQPMLIDFDFTMQSDQIVGIVGVNGSGKSTLLKLIAGLLKPKKGEILVFNKKAGHFSNKSVVGTSLQEIDFPPTEKPIEILKFVADQFDNPLSVNELIETYHISDFQNKACGQLSGGMKRRLSLACALVGNPKLLLLDEPTTGLDIDSRKVLMQSLREYKIKNQALILMISHHPEEVIDEVDQFYHVKKNFIQKVSTDQMNRLTRLQKITFQSRSKQELPNALHVNRLDDQVEIVVEDGDKALRQLCEQNFPFSNLTSRKLRADEILGEIL